jgi:hypothetical protein
MTAMDLMICRFVLTALSYHARQPTVTHTQKPTEYDL